MLYRGVCLCVAECHMSLNGGERHAQGPPRVYTQNRVELGLPPHAALFQGFRPGMPLSPR